MRPRKRDLATRVGFVALVTAGLISSGLSSAQDADARIRQLEEQLKVLTQELNALKEEVKQSKMHPSAAAPPAQAAAMQEGLRETQGQVQETRKQVSAMQSRLDSLVPNVRLGDGAYVEDPRGRWSLRATARAQFDYRNYPGEDGVLADTFAVRRARLGLGLTVGRMISGYIEANLASGVTSTGTTASTNLQQAWIDFAPLEALRIRAGQFKPQFGLEDTMTTWSNGFQERSVAIGLLQNFLYDRGVMVYGAPTAMAYSARFDRETSLDGGRGRAGVPWKSGCATASGTRGISRHRTRP